MFIKSRLSFLAGWLVAGASYATHIPLNSCQDLLAIPNFSQDHYQLSQDLDCTGLQAKQNLIFSGTLDGNHYQIKNLTLVPNNNYAGLFQFLRDATVKNLTLSHVQMTLRRPLSTKPHILGLLASCSYNSRLENVQVFDSQIDIQDPATQGVAGMMIGLVYQGEMHQVGSERNQIKIPSSIDRVGGLFGEVYDAKQINTAQVTNLTLLQTQTATKDASDTHHYGGVVGAIHESGVENIRVQDVQFPNPLPEGEHGLVFGHAESTWLHHASIEQNHKPQTQLSLLGLFSNHVGVTKTYQIQHIHVNQRQNWPWFVSVEFIQNKDLIDLSLEP